MWDVIMIQREQQMKQRSVSGQRGHRAKTWTWNCSFEQRKHKRIHLNGELDQTEQEQDVQKVLGGKKDALFILLLVRRTVLHVNSVSTLYVHSASPLRCPASTAQGNLSAAVFPLTGGTTTSLPALCSARWSNTHTHTRIDNFLSVLPSHTFCPRAIGGECWQI